MNCPILILGMRCPLKCLADDAKVTETLVMDAEEYDTADAENKCFKRGHFLQF